MFAVPRDCLTQRLAQRCCLQAKGLAKVAVIDHERLPEFIQHLDRFPRFGDEQTADAHHQRGDNTYLGRDTGEFRRHLDDFTPGDGGRVRHMPGTSERFFPFAEDHQCLTEVVDEGIAVRHVGVCVDLRRLASEQRSEETFAQCRAERLRSEEI